MSEAKSDSTDLLSSQIKFLWDCYTNGHRNIETVITMLEGKKTAFENNQHWFIIQDERNYCEFCGRTYAMRLQDGFCER